MPGYEETKRAERLEDRIDDLRAELDALLEAADAVVKSCFPGSVNFTAIGELTAAVERARKNRDA